MNGDGGSDAIHLRTLKGPVVISDGASTATLILDTSNQILDTAGLVHLIGNGISNVLTIGANNTDTTFSGTMKTTDGADGIVQTGSGKFTLAGSIGSPQRHSPVQSP
jgi:hypothetical protein